MPEQTVLEGVSTGWGADITADGRYRRRLWRVWDESLPRLAWVMLNPSTADAHRDDPTIRRCIGFARSHCYGGIDVVNLFQLRATDPDQVRYAGSRVALGPNPDDPIRATAPAAVVVAWGAVHRAMQPRSAEVLDLLHDTSRIVLCLGTTQDGHPRHPLYVPARQRLVPYAIGDADE